MHLWPTLPAVLCSTLGVFFSALSSTEARQSCENTLIWKKKYFRGGNHGYNLQICCNVTSISFQKVGSNSGLPLILNDLNGQNTYPLLISQCPGGVISEGETSFPQRDKCITKQGRIINVPTKGDFDMVYETEPLELDPEKDKKIENNNWYRVCYTSDSYGCTSCELEQFCTSQYNPQCENAFLKRRILEVTNESLSVQISVGAYMPFKGRLGIKILPAGRIGYSDKEAEPIYEISDIAMTKNTTLEPFVVENLDSDSWYTIKVCVRLTEIPRDTATKEVCMTPDAPFVTMANSGALFTPLFWCLMMLSSNLLLR